MTKTAQAKNSNDMDATEWIKDVIVMEPLDIRKFRGDRFAELMESYHLFKSKEESEVISELDGCNHYSDEPRAEAFQEGVDACLETLKELNNGNHD